MLFLFFRAYVHLIRFEFHLASGNFASLHQAVRDVPLGVSDAAPHILESVCSAVDMACVWYPKEVLCLQRSAATTSLLKKYGVAGRLVIGARAVPFRAHAWVEVQSRVVNDKPYMSDIYAILDRC